MGKGIRYSDEFKQEAVNQVVVHGYSVADVVARLDISTKRMKSFSKPTTQRKDDEDLRTDVARLKRELKRAQGERGILKEADVFFVGESKNGIRF